VEKHRASLMLKLGLKNATDMVLTAIELGLIERPTFVTKKAADADILDQPDATQ
jgi:hypothetical protein